MNTHLIVHKKLQEQSTKAIINCVKNIHLKEGKKILNCDDQTLGIFIENYLKD